MTRRIAVIVAGVLWAALPVAATAGAQTLTWSVVSSPDRGTSGNILNGVSCVSATACTAAGYYTNSSGAWRTLVESWNGTSWSVVPSPGTGILFGMSCVSPAACTAAGSSTSGSIDRTLIESGTATG